MDYLEIKDSDLRKIFKHLEELKPAEGCGLLAGKDGSVKQVYLIANRLNSPTAYEMDPAEQLAAMLEMEERDLDLVAIFHSHPHGPGAPSMTDIEMNNYPETLQLIVSWSDADQPTVRAFKIRESLVREVVVRNI